MPRRGDLRIMKKTVCIIALLVAATCCTGGPALPDALVFRNSCCVRQPLRNGTIRRVAVLEPRNATGSAEAAGKVMGPFTARLMETRRFELVERAQIDKVLQELKLGLSGIVDEKTAKEAGRLLGADAVITGEITAFQHDAKPFEYKYSRERAELLPLPPGDRTPSIIGVPAETRTYTVEKYYVSVSFTLRMIAVGSGEIVWSRHVSRSFGMREGEYEIRNVYDLLDRIVNAAVQEAVCDFAPAS